MDETPDPEDRASYSTNYRKKTSKKRKHALHFVKWGQSKQRNQPHKIEVQQTSDKSNMQLSTVKIVVVGDGARSPTLHRISLASSTL